MPTQQANAYRLQRGCKIWWTYVLGRDAVFLVTILKCNVSLGSRNIMLGFDHKVQELSETQLLYLPNNFSGKLISDLWKIWNPCTMVRLTWRLIYLLEWKVFFLCHELPVTFSEQLGLPLTLFSIGKVVHSRAIDSVVPPQERHQWTIGIILWSLR